MACVATLAQALAATGSDLAGHLDTAGRQWDATRLRTGNLTAVRIVAACAREAITLDPDLTEAPNPPPPPEREPPHLVLVMRRSADLPHGLRRLAALIDTAGHISPQHVRLIIRATAAAALAAVPVLRATGHDTQAATLDAHAGLLTGAVQHAGRLATIYRGDARPLAQAQQISLYLAASQRTRTALEPEQAQAIAAAVATVTTATADISYRMITTAAWVRPSETAGVAWEPTGRGSQFPALLERLTAAATHAAQLTAHHSPGLDPSIVTGQASARRGVHRLATTSRGSADRDAGTGRPAPVPARGGPRLPPVPPALTPPSPRPGPRR